MWVGIHTVIARWVGWMDGTAALWELFLPSLFFVKRVWRWIHFSQMCRLYNFSSPGRVGTPYKHQVVVSVQSLNRDQLFMIPWNVVNQAPLSMGFSRHQYWSGLPFPSPGDLSDPGMAPMSPALAGGFFTIEPHRKCQPLVCFVEEKFLTTRNH